MRLCANRSLKRLYRQLNDQKNREDGFTLVELLVTVVVASILSGVIITAFITGTLGFQMTNETSELRSEADYLIASVLSDVNRTEFDAVTEVDATFQFHRLSTPDISEAGMIYREAGYVSTDLTLSADSFTPSNPQISIERLTIQLRDPVFDPRRPSYMTGGLIEIEMDLSQTNDSDSVTTFESTIPF
ncbi:prepilin-type N-terminal cleavage/methylation domain-containing protein [Exiguobacterium qingdaonense]|uniref:prepilin-type N-terminal cleavage/methylation domain-containing protein n=1 Tax=Exiguobacterium qingdaonense TaxID=2751251 RepID=UPI001BE836CC|nr:prepilin-type N-terminal cleavage/methylation domain-containing protein [Exiguobacterium qingdaonense]